MDRLHAAFMGSAGACTDTRALVKDGMFFALKGPNFNANAFALKALHDGCAFAVVDDASVVVDDRFIVVPDVLAALQDLGRYHRRRFDVPVIAITGSNGKTTTKELLHAVLNADRSTLATIGNLNNHIGVPLTLLRLNASHRIAIIEMGANHVGDIAQLTDIAEPTHGMITNIGKAHLEGFGGYDGVVRAKSEMYDHLRAHGGTLFVHADDTLLMDRSAGAQRITYGRGLECSTQGRAYGAGSAFLAMEFRGRDGHSMFRANTRLIGNYNLPNVLAAVCIGQHFGVPDDTIVRAIEEFTPTNNRSQFNDTGRNHVVMDAYNANPSSMKAALENFAGLRSERPKLAILGGMKELGRESRTEHQAVVDMVRALGLDAVLVGPEFAELGITGLRIHRDADEALMALAQERMEGRLVLVKGSRGTHLETLMPAL